MKKIHFRAFSTTLLLTGLLWFSACQRNWHASPATTNSPFVLDSTVAVNPKIDSIINPYRLELETQMNEVIGVAPVALDKGPLESPLGNFITDLILERAGIAYGRKIDLALTTNGGLRTPIPQGNIKVGDIYELMPFENELVVLTLKGSTLYKLFDYAAKRQKAPIAGAQFVVHNETAAEITINGNLLSDTTTYTLVTSDYLANGGDNMPFLKEALNYEQLGITFRDAILNHIKALTAAGKPVVAPEGRRVLVVD